MGDIHSLFSTKGITDSVRILHTPGEFARKNLLYVQEVGRLKSLQPHKSQRENLNSFLFVGVTSGEGTVFAGGSSYKVGKGTAPCSTVPIIMPMKAARKNRGS